MINGTLSKIIYIGAYLMSAICLVGYFLLKSLDKPIDPELWIAFGASIGIVGGAHLKPPVNTSATTALIADLEAEKAKRQ